MGQKTHPIGFRLGIVKDWSSRWYAERDFPRLLKEDETLRKYLRRRLSHAALALVEIERKPGKVVVTLHTARPGVVIGKRGAEVDKLRDELAMLANAEISVNVEEIKRPEVSAYLVAENVAHQQEVGLGEFFVDGVHVMSGLAPGQTVVVAGQQRLRPGSPAEPEPYAPTTNRNLELGRYGPASECTFGMPR